VGVELKGLADRVLHPGHELQGVFVHPVIGRPGSKEVFGQVKNQIDNQNSVINLILQHYNTIPYAFLNFHYYVLGK